jgi:hypothetical protein
VSRLEVGAVTGADTWDSESSAPNGTISGSKLEATVDD